MDFGTISNESLKRITKWKASYFTHTESYYPVPHTSEGLPGVLGNKGTRTPPGRPSLVYHSVPLNLFLKSPSPLNLTLSRWMNLKVTQTVTVTKQSRKRF